MQTFEGSNPFPCTILFKTFAEGTVYKWSLNIRLMSTILIRYAELGLKSRMVRRRFENLLRDNILSALAKGRVEALLHSDEGRFYVEADDVDSAVTCIRRVFGVASVSVAETCSSDLEEICKHAAAYSMSRLQPGQSFAVRPRREGTHPYTSVEIGRNAGSAIYLANEHLGIKVDLSSPDVEIFIEVRGPKAFIFDTYQDGPGGLPMGTQGKVIAFVKDDRDALAAWMLMKRGCRILVSGLAHPLLQAYDPDLKMLKDDAELFIGDDVLGVVTGLGMEDFGALKDMSFEVPVYAPLVGMDDEEIKRRLKEMV